jgi:hypothetical protein
VFEERREGPAAIGFVVDDENGRHPWPFLSRRVMGVEWSVLRCPTCWGGIYRGEKAGQ